MYPWIRRVLARVTPRLAPPYVAFVTTEIDVTIIGAAPSEAAALTLLRQWYAEQRERIFPAESPWAPAPPWPDPATATLAELDTWYSNHEVGYYAAIQRARY